LKPNLHDGHHLDVFIYLDNDLRHVKVSHLMYRHDYSDPIYNNYSNSELKQLVINQFENHVNISLHVRLEPPEVTEYPVIGPRPFNCLTRRSFQNLMHWQAGLRNCVKWVEAHEIRHKLFYDFVVRLREDTYAFAAWKFDSTHFKNALTSQSSGNWAAVNDHNLVIDRIYADKIFRGIIEDYYLNRDRVKLECVAPEHQILKLSQYYHIPKKEKNGCDMPLIPLRGEFNATHWRLHLLYVDDMVKSHREIRCFLKLKKYISHEVVSKYTADINARRKKKK